MYTVGIDIGGTKIKFGLFDKSSQLIKEMEISTPKRAVIELLIESLHKLIGPSRIQGIGIATAGIVDFEKGIITKAANIPEFVKLPLKEMLEKEFDVPTVVLNDANSAALAEGKEGAAKQIKNYMMITVGTGIGSGIIQEGIPVHGKNGYGGEVGHMIIHPEGLPCGCGRIGCWEKYASGRAIAGMIRNNPDLAAKEYQPKDIFNEYEKNDSCRRVVDSFIENLSLGIVNLQYIVDPDMIVIGGGVIHSSEKWWKLLIDKISTTSFVPVNLQKAVMKNNASMIGAGYVARI